MITLLLAASLQAAAPAAAAPAADYPPCSATVKDQCVEGGKAMHKAKKRKKK